MTIAYDITFNAPREVRKDCPLCGGVGRVPVRLVRCRGISHLRLIALRGKHPGDPPNSRCCPVCDCGEVAEDDPPP